MYDDKTPEERFMEEHPEVEKFYTMSVSEKDSKAYASLFDKCYLERPTNEQADFTLDDILYNFSCEIYPYEELTLYVDIYEVTVKHTDTGEPYYDAEHFANDYDLLYTRERTINGQKGV